MKKQANAEELRIPQLEDFEDYRTARDKLGELQAQLSSAESRLAEIEVLLETTERRGLKQITLQAMQALGLARRPDGPEVLLREQEEILAGLPLLREQIRLQRLELDRIKSQVGQQICEILRDPYLEAVRAFGQALLAAGQAYARVRRITETLDARGVSFAHILRPFYLPWIDLADAYSDAARTLREMHDFGVDVPGWQDPMRTKPGAPRRVELLTTMAGPDGIRFRGDIIRSEHADYLVRTRQASELGIAAQRAALDRLAQDGEVGDPLPAAS